MASYDIKTLSLGATTTGSDSFSLYASPYYAVQVYATGSAGSVEFVQAYYSNFEIQDVAGAQADHPGSDPTGALTGSGYDKYWVQDTSFSGTVMTEGGGAQSLGWTLGNVGYKFGRIKFGTRTGGTFILAKNRKD